MLNHSPNKTKVIVGMSGGVDSSVSALLLQQQGYHVEGLFMKNWDEDDGTEYCTAQQDFNDAQAVCNTLGIKLHGANFAAEYWDNVFAYFLAEYKAGRTPNPDILCNKEIKFKAFFDYAIHLNADYIATGHYVQTQSIQGGDSVELLKGLDANKDQSYFLYAVDARPLSQTLFPIGHLHKHKVRALAHSSGLVTHNKKDSTGICFIGERRFKDFLKTYIPAQTGDIITEKGQVIGKHQGLMFYTIGQRQGLGIGGHPQFGELPWYVADKLLATNQLLVVQGENHPRLFKSTLTCKQLSCINGKQSLVGLDSNHNEGLLTAKIRYRQVDQSCRLKQVDDDEYQVYFDTKQRAVTPGQSIVFYHNNICLGGAIIE